MRAELVFVLALALSATGCANSGSGAASKERVADKDVNTRHLKGTTDVLKTYRYGERPVGRKAAAEQKGQKSPEKSK